MHRQSFRVTRSRLAGRAALPAEFAATAGGDDGDGGGGGGGTVGTAADSSSHIAADALEAAATQHTPVVSHGHGDGGSGAQDELTRMIQAGDKRRMGSSGTPGGNESGGGGSISPKRPRPALAADVHSNTASESSGGPRDVLDFSDDDDDSAATPTTTVVASAAAAAAVANPCNRSLSQSAAASEASCTRSAQVRRELYCKVANMPPAVPTATDSGGSAFSEHASDDDDSDSDYAYGDVARSVHRGPTRRDSHHVAASSSLPGGGGGGGGAAAAAATQAQFARPTLAMARQFVPRGRQPQRVGADAFDILGNGGVHAFRDWPFSLEDTPSADGTIDPRTGRPTRVVDQPDIPYGPQWIRERIARLAAASSNPVFRFVSNTAGVVDSRVEEFWQAPETVFQASAPTRGGRARGVFDDATSASAGRRSAAEREAAGAEQRAALDKILENDEVLRNLRTDMEEQTSQLQQLTADIVALRQRQQQHVADTGDADAQITDQITLKRQQQRTLSNSLDANRKRVAERTRILSAAFTRRTELGQLLFRANPQTQFVRTWLSFLDQLAESGDPDAVQFAEALQRAAEQQFAGRSGSDGGGGAAAAVTPDRADARRLWMQLPENLGMFFWTNVFSSALQQAYDAVLHVAGRHLLLYDLMTQQLVSGRFSMLVGQYVLVARASNSTRFQTRDAHRTRVRRIRGLIEWFRHVQYAPGSHDGEMLYYGTNAQRDPVFARRRAELRAAAAARSSGTEWGGGDVEVVDF